MKTSVRICPVCKKRYTEHPALSRRDNKTEICPSCGAMEAVGDFVKNCFLKTGGEQNDAKCGQ